MRDRSGSDEGVLQGRDWTLTAIAEALIPAKSPDSQAVQSRCVS